MWPILGTTVRSKSPNGMSKSIPMAKVARVKDPYKITKQTKTIVNVGGVNVTIIKQSITDGNYKTVAYGANSQLQYGSGTAGAIISKYG